MALKYWYKSTTGFSDWTVLGNWYNGSGGTGGQALAIPNSSDDVIFDVNSTPTGIANGVQILTTASCNSLNCTGFAGDFRTESGSTLNITNTTTRSADSSTPLFALSATGYSQLFGALIFGGSGGGGWIYLNGASIGTPVTFNNAAATFTFKDTFYIGATGGSITLTAGNIIATDAPVMCWSITSNSQSAKTFICTDLYLRGYGTLYTLGTSSIGLISTITNIYLTGPNDIESTAKTILFNSQFGSANLYISGSGNTSIAVGSFFQPNVILSNTVGSTPVFNITANSTISSLVFAAGSTITWTNAAITLTVGGNITLVSTLNVTATPTISIAGSCNFTSADEIFTSPITVASGGTYFLDAFNSSSTLSIVGFASFNASFSTSSTISVSGSINVYGSSINATTLTLTGTCTIYVSALTITGNLTINGAGRLVMSLISTVNCSGTTTLGSGGTLQLDGDYTSNAITVSNGNISPDISNTTIGSLTCTGTLTFSLGTIKSNNQISAGIFAQTGTNAKSLTATDFYLTGSGTLYTATSSTGLTATINAIYLTNSSINGKTFTCNSQFPGFTSTGVPIYLGGSGTGTFTLAVSTVSIPRVFVTSTGGGTVTFTTGVMRSLTFVDGTNVLWNNAATQTLTIYGNLRFAASQQLAQVTPALLFNQGTNLATNNSTITMNGNRLVTGILTVNNIYQSMEFLDNFTTNVAVTITNCFSSVAFGTFSCTTLTNTNNSTFDFQGDLTASNLVLSGTSTTYFGPNVTANITTSIALSSATAVGSTLYTNPDVIINCGNLTCSGNSYIQMDSTDLNCGSVVCTTGGNVNLYNNCNLICSGIFSTTNGYIVLIGTNTTRPVASFTSFTMSGASSQLYMDRGHLYITGSGTAYSMATASYSSVVNNSIIEFTDATSNLLTFIPGGFTYSEIIFNRGASTGQITISGATSNNYENFRDWGTAGHALAFASGSTHYFSHFDVKGSPGNYIAISRSGTTPLPILAKSIAGLVICDWVTVNNVTAETLNTFYSGPNSTLTSALNWIGSGKVRNQSALGAG